MNSFFPLKSLFTCYMALPCTFTSMLQSHDAIRQLTQTCTWQTDRQFVSSVWIQPFSILTADVGAYQADAQTQLRLHTPQTCSMLTSVIVTNINTLTVPGVQVNCVPSADIADSRSKLCVVVMVTKLHVRHVNQLWTPTIHHCDRDKHLLVMDKSAFSLCRGEDDEDEEMKAN